MILVDFEDIGPDDGNGSDRSLARLEDYWFWLSVHEIDA